MITLTKTEKLKLCSGCDSDYYNHENRSTTGKCWSLDNAKKVKGYCIGWWTPMDKKENFISCTFLSCRTETGKYLYMKELPKHLQK